jgi:hypothetical protein
MSSTPTTVIPAQAGIQLSKYSIVAKLDSRLRGNDELVAAGACA